MIFELNIFNLQRQPSVFDDIKNSTLNWVERSTFRDKFDGMLAVGYESFIIKDDLEYDMFEFDDLCFIFECLIGYVTESDSLINLLN